VRRRAGPLGAAVVVAIVAAVAAVAIARDSGSDESSRSGSPEVFAGAGTALPDGFDVAPGSSLLGPVVVDDVDAAGEPVSWFAILLVDGDPITVWSAYAAQVAEFAPDSGIEPEAAPGCQTAGLIPGDAVCELTGRAVDSAGAHVSVNVAMASTPGDVTGRYLIQLTADRPQYEQDEGSDVDPPPPWSGDPLPDPQPARSGPAVGDPLAPETVAYQGDDERYVVVDGSELVAQYSDGSLTGGFGVLLRIRGAADLDAITQAHVEQANQFEGEPVEAPRVVEHAGTTVRVFSPPGGAGGYSGRIWSIDRPDGDDYLVFELVND
jgi:hypothetical protein